MSAYNDPRFRVPSLAPPPVDEFRRCCTCNKPLHWTDNRGKGPIRLADQREVCSGRCQDAARGKR
jgi:hypothetical protein